MDKPSSEEKALERARSAVQTQIAGIVKRSKTMNFEPDLSPIWDGEEFQGLPPDAQAEIRAWAEKEGYAKPETSPATEQVELDDPRTEAVRTQIAGIVKRSKTMNFEPDLSPIWDGEDFNALTPALRSAVRQWAVDKGFLVEAAPETTPEPERQEPARAQRKETPESKERKERREGPKRKFIRYRVAPEADGGFSVEEDYEEWNDEADRYESKTVKTAIAFTPGLAEKIANDPNVAETVAGFCGQVRGELDRSGVKIFFDPQKGEPEKIFPKWKYALEGKTVQVPIKLDEIPPEIVALVKDDLVKGKKQYFNTPAWKKWFGPQMQRKREDIISAELGKLFPETAAVPMAETRTEPAKTETAPVDAPAQEPRRQDAAAEPARAEAAPDAVETQTAVTPELAAGIDMLVDKFTPLFELPKDAEKLVEYITQFSKGIFEYQVSRSGAKKKTLPPGVLRDAIKASVLAKFSDDRAMVAEIRRVMPERPPEPPPPPADAADDTIEVEDGDYEVVESVPEKKKESPADAAYKALRDDLDKLGSPKDLEEFEFSLRELKKSGLDTVSAAADRLLKDIDFGRAGELSEDRTEGLDRTPAEKEFFEQHPGLDKRNIQRLEDGRVIAHIDRLHPTDALRRTLGRTVDDALAIRGIEADPKMLARISEYVMNIVTGRNPNETITSRFTKDLAAFDQRAEEFIIKNIDKLGGVIANLAKKIESERK